MNPADKVPLQHDAAAPSFEPASLPESAAESGRRILWIVGVYRAVCGAALLGTALLLDLKVLGIAAPNTFVWASALYFVFGLITFVWIQREPIVLSLPALVSTLLTGDVLCIALVMVAGGGTGGSLPILLFPQLAASGWLLRTQTAFFHAAIASFVLLGLDVWRMLEGRVTGAQPFQTGLIGFGYFATIGIAVALGRYTKASEDLAAQRGIDVANLEQVNRLIIQDMQDGVLVVDLNGVVPRPQRAGDAAARRLRPHARRHAAGRVQLDPARLLAPLAGGPTERCRRSRSRRRSGSCACGWCESDRG